MSNIYAQSYFIFEVWISEFNTMDISLSKREPYQEKCLKSAEMLWTLTENGGRGPGAG